MARTCGGAALDLAGTSQANRHGHAAVAAWAWSFMLGAAVDP
jgi:hypothetical protein